MAAFMLCPKNSSALSPPNTATYYKGQPMEGGKIVFLLPQTVAEPILSA